MSDPKKPFDPAVPAGLPVKPTPSPEIKHPYPTDPYPVPLSPRQDDYPLTGKPAKYTQPTEHGSPMTTDPTSRPVVQPPVNTRPVSKDPAHPTLAELKEQAEWDDKHQRAENR